MSSENITSTTLDSQNIVGQGDTVILAYKGMFKNQTSFHILNWIERYLSSNSTVTRPESKKIFRVAVELIQNLIHHSSKSVASFVFIKSESNDCFTLSTSNLVDTNQANGLVSALNSMNTITEDKLRALKKRVMTSDVRSEHGGGGMGLLELAKLSNGSIESELLPSRNDMLLFCLSVHVNSIKT